MSEFVPASQLYIVESRTPIAHPAHQATDADVRRALEQREIRADGGHSSSGTEQCPVCGSGLIDWTEDLGIQWCDGCENGYWRFDSEWFQLDDGGIAREVDPATDREDGDSR